MPEGIEVTEQGYLRIYRVLDVDEGNYRCTAKNSQGSITSKAGFLKVIGTLFSLKMFISLISYNLKPL